MKLEYKVHSVTVDQAPVEATVAGKPRTVLADVLTVELVADGSALTYRFDDIEAGRKLFKQGKRIHLTFTGAK